MRGFGACRGVVVSALLCLALAGCGSSSAVRVAAPVATRLRRVATEAKGSVALVESSPSTVGQAAEDLCSGWSRSLRSQFLAQTRTDSSHQFNRWLRTSAWDAPDADSMILGNTPDYSELQAALGGVLSLGSTTAVMGGMSADARALVAQMDAACAKATA